MTLKFPEDVQGWLTEKEGQKLYELAAGKLVLEMGSYCGRSTICMAQSAKQVVAVDTFHCTNTVGDGNKYPEFEENIKRYGVKDRIHVSCGRFDLELRYLASQAPQEFDLVFVDGSHDEASVTEDIQLALPLLHPNGIISFHDYAYPGLWPDVKKVVDAWRGQRRMEQVDSLAVIYLDK